MPIHSSSVWMSATTATQSNATTATDQNLAAAYRGGDERAAAELVARHGPALARFLYGSGAGSDEVDDLVQEALFRAFRRLDSWRRDASFRTWLLSIAGNLLKDRVRAEKGRRVVSLEGHEIADAADPDSHLTTRNGRSFCCGPRRGLSMSRSPVRWVPPRVPRGCTTTMQSSVSRS